MVMDDVYCFFFLFCFLLLFLHCVCVCVCVCVAVVVVDIVVVALQELVECMTRCGYHPDLVAKGDGILVQLFLWLHSSRE